MDGMSLSNQSINKVSSETKEVPHVKKILERKLSSELCLMDMFGINWSLGCINVLRNVQIPLLTTENLFSSVKIRKQ